VHGQPRVQRPGKKNEQTGSWEDGDVLFIRGTAFKEHAENIAESLSISSEVLITGRLKTDQWQDKISGEKRSSMVLDRSVSALVNGESRQGRSSTGQRIGPRLVVECAGRRVRGSPALLIRLPSPTPDAGSQPARRCRVTVALAGCLGWRVDDDALKLRRRSAPSSVTAWPSSRTPAAGSSPPSWCWNSSSTTLSTRRGF
jgi:single-stranded DNA-binding protein